ncbi:hypothetical protein ACLMJK_006241 [Lecanora helva]
MAVSDLTLIDEFWRAELPGIISFLDKIGIHIVPKERWAATFKIEEWVMNKCMAAEKFIASVQTASELLDHIIAGKETTGIALTYIMYELSKHPHIQDQLRLELRSLSPSLTYGTSNEDTENTALPSPHSIDSLSLLHAIIMETLRLHAPLPGPQPRITPSRCTALANYSSLPPGVRVSSLAYTLHCNPYVFPSPLIWNPSRWLDASEADKAEMGRWFWAFGGGGRMCVGSNFAMQEMKVIVAAVYSNFRTKVVDDQGIEQKDGYGAPPSGRKLVLKFEKV